MMDIGIVVIHVTGGKALVSRCEEAPNGVRLVPAANAADLEPQAATFMQGLNVSFDQDGIYVCSDALQAAAQFAPLTLPADAITYGQARQLLYPDVSVNTGWQRVRRDAKAGKLRVWRTGIGHESRYYLSRAEVLKLVEERTVAATA